ncbi:hypothetical protein, partial [Treponema sp.]|uniref:hypothetical protein n=1 Tax=Treponema sp. TaxID=166 RepID=UPI003EFF4E98
MLQKIFIAAIFILAGNFPAFSLPGVKQYIPDTSGEYVYYRDKTFRSAAIVGFLYYSEDTYAARFYSPADAEKKQPAKDITIYVSVNPDSAKGIEFTGEKIHGAVSQEDTDIINYMHDLFYEFTFRRQKAQLVSDQAVIERQDFPQFGGTVDIKFSSFVPIFNIAEIKAADGQNIFSIETSGRLLSSEDKSFALFMGVEGLPKDKKRVLKKVKAEEQTVEFGSQKITLDTRWKHSMENLWLLEDFAILSMTSVEFPEEQKKSAMDILLRRVCQSTNLSYSISPQKKITVENDRVTVMNVFYQPESENITRDFKIITQNKDGKISLCTLTLFDSV